MTKLLDLFKGIAILLIIWLHYELYVLFAILVMEGPPHPEDAQWLRDISFFANIF